MKLAYCITCHKNTKVLRSLVKYIKQNGDVYIHIDKKSDIKEFEGFDDNVRILKNRVKVSWGNFTQIQTMINLLEVTANKGYDYVFMLSGDDLPVKSNEYTNKFLKDNYGFEFVGCDFTSEIDKKIMYKYNKLWYSRNKNFMEQITCRVQEKMGMFSKNKLYEKLPKLYKGTNWFTITGDCAEYILQYLNENKEYVDAYKYSFCGDEIFFHTIILNSKFKEKIYGKNREDNRDSLRYIDWKSGPDYPKILDQNDYEKIKIMDDVLFARKFSDNININEHENFFEL